MIEIWGSSSCQRLFAGLWAQHIAIAHNFGRCIRLSPVVFNKADGGNRGGVALQQGVQAFARRVWATKFGRGQMDRSHRLAAHIVHQPQLIVPCPDLSAPADPQRNPAEGREISQHAAMASAASCWGWGFIQYRQATCRELRLPNWRISRRAT